MSYIILVLVLVLWSWLFLLTFRTGTQRPKSKRGARKSLQSIQLTLYVNISLKSINNKLTINNYIIHADKPFVLLSPPHPSPNKALRSDIENENKTVFGRPRQIRRKSVNKYCFLNYSFLTISFAFDFNKYGGDCIFRQWDFAWDKKHYRYTCLSFKIEFSPIFLWINKTYGNLKRSKKKKKRQIVHVIFINFIAQ